MSAWIVSKNHIHVLVQALFKYELVTDMTPDETGKLLWKENYRSVNYRYEERKRAPKYTHDSTAVCSQFVDRTTGYTTLGTVQEVARDPWIVFKLLHCYEYHSSERPDWEYAAACKLMIRLEAALLRHLSLTRDEAFKTPQWHAGPWGID